MVSDEEYEKVCRERDEAMGAMIEAIALIDPKEGTDG